MRGISMSSVITASSGSIQRHRRLGWKARQHGVTERAQAETRRAEGDAHAGTKQGAQNCRLLHHARLTWLQVNLR
jgi:hypothetical protein